MGDLIHSIDERFSTPLMRDLIHSNKVNSKQLEYTQSSWAYVQSKRLMYFKIVNQ